MPPDVETPNIEDPQLELAEHLEAPPETPPDPAAEVARLREENARLTGENRALREPVRREEFARPAPTQPVDLYATEFQAIEDAYRKGDITDAERTIRLGALGAETALARKEQRDREASAKTRGEQARLRAGQKISAYVSRFPGLKDPASSDMQRVNPHLRAVCEELDLPAEDERAQALALERAYGPLDRSPSMAEQREFERRRHPVGGGGGGGGEEPPTPSRQESKGERLFKRLLPQHQQFYLQTRGSREAAVRTLEHADEDQMRKQGRFA